MKPIVVLACGNPLRGDDGVAWHIGSALKDVLQHETVNSGIEIILSQQLLPEHAEPLSRTNIAFFLDCSAITQPGVVSTYILSPALRLPRIFTHHLDPASLLKLTQDLYGHIPSRAVAITVGGQSFKLREELSISVAAAIPAVVEAVRRGYLHAEQE